ncbi:LmeA family phospholipid-binding protein [Rhizohabitans arisaemae]|uniref:LmeA family phospholipid-binding protein n=1 Tax=Rhizohabitans arisaemae TaxID=2720610 RepID=UPI0024B0EA44|nr:DUF2993 domain-containing protein [Rhizohabitans arisaemae]
MRKLIVVFILFVGVLAVVDRLLVDAIEKDISREIAARFNLSEQPEVVIEGIPFITQAVAGRYDEITVTIGPVARDGMRLQRVEGKLYGVTAPLFRLITNAAEVDVRAERATGTVLVSKDVLAARAPRGVTLESSDGELTAAGQVTVVGRPVQVKAALKLDVVAGGIRVTPVNVQFANGIPVPGVDRRLAFTIPVRNLPLGLKLTEVRSTAKGLEIKGEATNLPLRG